MWVSRLKIVFPFIELLHIEQQGIKLYIFRDNKGYNSLENQ